MMLLVLERERREGFRQGMAVTVLVGHGALSEAKVGTERSLSPAQYRTRECQLMNIFTLRMPLMEVRSLKAYITGLQTFLHWYTLEDFF